MFIVNLYNIRILQICREVVEFGPVKIYLKIKIV